MPPGHPTGLTHTTEPIRVVMTCPECGLDRDSLEFVSLGAEYRDLGLGSGRSCRASHQLLESGVAGGSCPVPEPSDARGCPPYRVRDSRTIRTPESGTETDPEGTQTDPNRTPTAPNREKQPENRCIPESTVGARSEHGGCTGHDSSRIDDFLLITGAAPPPEGESSSISGMRPLSGRHQAAITDRESGIEPTNPVIRPCSDRATPLEGPLDESPEPEAVEPFLDRASSGFAGPEPPDIETREEESGVD